MTEHWNYWQSLSKDGKACGIIGCGQTPKNKCPVCNQFYCTEDIKIHYHVTVEVKK